MKQFVLKKSGNEFDDDSKKYERMNDKLNELYEKLQGDVSEEEGDAIIEEFQNLIKNCGSAFELRVIPGFDSSVVTGESKAGALIFGITTNMKPDLITECFKACTQAFSKELERQIIEAHANPSICAVGSLFDLSSDQTIDCFESAVDAFQDRLQQKIRSYCDINNANKRGKCYVH